MEQAGHRQRTTESADLSAAGRDVSFSEKSQ
jgi:hypothetical protein